VHFKACDGPQWNVVDVGPNIFDGIWDGDRFERDDRDVATDKSPGSDKRTAWTASAKNKVVRAACFGHGRGQFRIDQAHNGREDAPDEVRYGCPSRACFEQPSLGQHHPAKGDHGAESKSENVSIG